MVLLGEYWKPVKEKRENEKGKHRGRRHSTLLSLFWGQPGGGRRHREKGGHRTGY